MGCIRSWYRVFSFVVIVVFIINNSIIAQPLLNNTGTDIVSNEFLAVNTQIRDVISQIRVLFTGTAIHEAFARAEVDSLEDIITEREVVIAQVAAAMSIPLDVLNQFKTLVFSDKEDSSKVVYYTFSPQGYFYRCRNAENVNDAFSQFLPVDSSNESKEISTDVDGQKYFIDVFPIPEESLSLINACLRELYGIDLTPQETDSLKNVEKIIIPLYRAMIENKTSFTVAQAAEQFNLSIDEAKHLLDWFASLDREFDTYRGIERVVVDGKDVYRWLDPETINTDIFRDYDYRSKTQANIDFSPKRTFYMTLTWIQMAKEEREVNQLVTQNKVVIARDCRKSDPEMMEAIIKAVEISGLQAVNVHINPNCASSYAYAVRPHNPLMGIIMTASHVKGDNVMGAKVSINRGNGELESLTTQQIKETSFKKLKALLAASDLSQNQVAVDERKQIIKDRSVEQNHTKMAQVVGLVLSGSFKVIDNKINLLQLAQIFEKAEQEGTLTEVIEEYLETKLEVTAQPYKGLKIVVEGAHTPSGKLCAEIYRKLGAEIRLLRGEVRELGGQHDADPSNAANLQGLFDAMEESDADMGLAFDLDGDRGQIVVPCDEFQEDTGRKLKRLTPDNITAALLPFFVKNGYDPEKMKVAVVRDCLSTKGVDKMAESLGIESFQTDAGYVFLKQKVRELKASGYVVPMYAERSGHAWTHMTGAFEDPIVVSMMFTQMILSERQNAESFNEVFDMVTQNVQYKQSPRTMPDFGVAMLKKLSNHERNETLWTYESGEPLSNASVVAIGRHEVIQALMKEFEPGNQYDTPLGTIKVKVFNTVYDEQAKINRFADIQFVDVEDNEVGSIVFRASSNDPAYVCSFEAPVNTKDGETFESEVVKKRFMSVAGLVLSWLEDQDLAKVTTGDYENAQLVRRTVNAYRIAMIDAARVQEMQDKIIAAADDSYNAIPENRYCRLGFDGEKARLGWVKKQDVEGITDVINDLQGVLEGKEHFIFIGIGGSGNTIKALKKMYDAKNIHAIDSLDPAAIEKILRDIGRDNLGKTAVIPISKSAGTAETHGLANIFRKIFLQQNLSIPEHFIWMIDEENKYKLEERGWDSEVRTVPIQPDGKTDIGGRFTAPFTMIFLLPLYILHDMDLDTTLEKYQRFAEPDMMQEIQKQATEQALVLFEQGAEYLAVRMQGPRQKQALATWMTQLLQESLGGKKEDAYNPKTVVLNNDDMMPDDFSEIVVPYDTAEGPAYNMMIAAYYMQILTAGLAYLHDINFVTQEGVEVYKDKGRSLEQEGAELPEISSIDFQGLVKQLKQALKPHQKFIEIVIYARLDDTEYAYIQERLQNEFKKQTVLVFEGSDWNHHSYQAVPTNTDTLFGIVLADSYVNSIENVDSVILQENIKKLEMLAYATYLTLEDRGFITRLVLQESPMQGSHISRKITSSEGKDNVTLVLDVDNKGELILDQSKTKATLALAESQIQKINGALVKAVEQFGVGIVTQIDVIEVVQGLRSTMYRQGRAPLAVFVVEDQGIRKLKLDISVFQSQLLVNEEVLHECFESIACLLPGTTNAIADVVSTLVNVRTFLVSSVEEQDEFIALLNARKALDSDGLYAALLTSLQGVKDLNDDVLIAQVAQYALKTKSYKNMHNDLGLATALATRLRDAELQTEHAIDVLSGIRTARLNAMLLKIKEQEELSVKVVKSFSGQARIEGLTAISTSCARVVVASVKLASKMNILQRRLENLLPQNKENESNIIIVDTDRIPEQMRLQWQRTQASLEKLGFSIVNSLEEAKTHEGYHYKRTIHLIDPADVADMKDKGLGIDCMYLPMPYMRSSLFMAAHVLIAGGEMDLLDSLVKQLIFDMYPNLKNLNDADQQKLFSQPWSRHILPQIMPVVQEMDYIHRAMIEIEKAA